MIETYYFKHFIFLFLILSYYPDSELYIVDPPKNVLPKYWYDVLGINYSYFVKNDSKSSSKYIQVDFFQNACFSSTTFLSNVVVVFSTNGQHTNEKKMCSSTQRLISSLC